MTEEEEIKLKEDNVAILSMVMVEYHRLRRVEGKTEGAYPKAIATVASGLGIPESEVRIAANAARSDQKRAAKALKEQDLEDVGDDIPRGVRSNSNVFESDDAILSMSNDLKGAKVGQVVSFDCKTHARALHFKGLMGRATQKARWRGYQTRIVSNMLHVRRTK